MSDHITAIIKAGNDVADPKAVQKADMRYRALEIEEVVAMEGAQGIRHRETRVDLRMTEFLRLRGNLLIGSEIDWTP